MVSVFYVIVLEAIVCGLMLNRTLYSKVRMMLHLPLYVIIKAVVCTWTVMHGFHQLTTPLCILFSLLYALTAFNDSIKRKLVVMLCGVLCLAAANLLKFVMLNSMGLTQNFGTTPDILSTKIVLCVSLLFFCIFTIICTNLLCGVRVIITFGILLVSILLMLFIGLIYTCMHMLIPKSFNYLYSVFALFFLLPSLASLYFGESITFSRKDRYFRE